MIIRRMPIYDLRLGSSGFDNPRKRSGLSPAAIRRLARSIVENGLLYPLVVSPEGIILGGQRRYLALCELIERPESLTSDENDTLAFARCHEYDTEGIPVVIAQEAEDVADARMIALADNEHRSQLSSYELAIEVYRLTTEHKKSRAEIARTIGRSKSYVSRLNKAVVQSGRELRRAWAADRIPFERVKEIAELSEDDQKAVVDQELAERKVHNGRPAPKKARHRGGHGRPGIDEVKARLKRAQERLGDEGDDEYTRGILDALAFVAGESIAHSDFDRVTS